MSVRRWMVLCITALAVPLSFVAAPYPEELLLQHVPTVAAIAMLAVAIGWYRPSSLSFYCCAIFLWLHIIGARWIYSFVPYDTVIQRLTGVSISETFDFQRNHYDRLVHLASGVFGLPPISEMLQTFCKLRPAMAAILGLSCVLAIGAVYEIIEWQIAMQFSPEMAEAYNGQQGDVWDAQKDLTLALVGAMLTIPIIWRWSPASPATAKT